MHDEFKAMIRDAVLANDPHADPTHIDHVVAGVAADPTWTPLTWMSRQIASGHYATALAERAVALSSALKKVVVTTPSKSAPANDAQTIAAAFGMTMEQWRSTPPETKSRLAAALTDKQADDQHRATSVATLKGKIDSGDATPDQKLEYSRLAGEPAATKAQRRDPRFLEAQQARMSLPELRKIQYGHATTAASGEYPPTYRKMHQDHADRIGRIIKEREDAGEV